MKLIFAGFFLFLIYIFPALLIANWVANTLIKWMDKRLQYKPDKTKYLCDGCGNEFNHPLHNHYGYNSCSSDCDDFLNDVFQETY